MRLATEWLRTVTAALRRRGPTLATSGRHPSSVGSSRRLGVVALGGVFVVDGAGLQAAVEDTDEAVAELA
jgi:hypothetical protein